MVAIAHGAQRVLRLCDCDLPKKTAHVRCLIVFDSQVPCFIYAMGIGRAVGKSFGLP